MFEEAIKILFLLRAKDHDALFQWLCEKAAGMARGDALWAKIKPIVDAELRLGR